MTLCVMTTASRLLDAYVGRFRPSGVLTTLEDTRRSALIVLAFAATAPLQVVVFMAAFAINGERAMLVLSVLVLLVDVIALPVLVASGSLLAYGRISTWRLVIGGIIGHILLGGFLWSGGYLWAGALATTAAALALRERDSLALGAVTITAALIFAPFEGWFRTTRDAPALGLSVFLFVWLGMLTVAWLAPLIVILRRRLRHDARHRTLHGGPNPRRSTVPSSAPRSCAAPGRGPAGLAVHAAP